MAQRQIRGTTQIMDLTVGNAKLIDGDITLAKLAQGDDIVLRDGSVPMTGDLDLGTNKIVNVVDPTADQDAATKKYVDDNISALTGVLTLKGGFDASVGTFPAATETGWMYIVTTAGVIDGMDMNIGDHIVANATPASTTSAADWLKIDNTEAADILRTGDVSTDLDLSNDGSSLTDRATIKSNIDSAITTALGTDVWGEELTVTNNVPTVSVIANTPTVGTVRVYLNGLRMQPGSGEDYTISGTAITFEYNLHNNDTVFVDYTY